MTDPQIHIHIHNEGCGTESLTQRVTALEALVMTFETQLNDIRNLVLESNEDVQAALAALQAQIDAIGNPAALQTAIDDLKAAVQAGVDAVGDADGDGNPAPTTPEPPAEPTP